MSYTTVIALWPGEKNEDFEKLGNSHGSAPPVWNSMCKKYYGTEDHAYMFNGTLNRLWPRWKDLSIPEHQRAVLMMTFDRAYVSKKYYARAVKDIDLFFKDFPPNPEYVNHWPRLREIYESDPDIPAIGLHCTSVSENPFDGEWNEEKEEYDQPDWEECYDIYIELDNLKIYQGDFK